MTVYEVELIRENTRLLAEVARLTEKITAMDARIWAGLGRESEHAKDKDALREEVARLTAYADKLAAALPEGMLPKDVELLRARLSELEEELNIVERERDRLQKFEDALYEIKAERKELKAALSESRAREADTWERVKRLEQEEIPRLKASLRPIQDG